MGRNTYKLMKNRILELAKRDIPLYFEDFKNFWDESLDQIQDDDLFDIYQATLVFKNWKLALNAMSLSEYDKIIEEIYEDINSSLFLALLGLYRSSHMHMRSSIELTLQLIYFFHHPIEYRKWNEGEFVIKHNDLTEYIIKHPNFNIDIRDFITSITQNWKYFSKHIHGESPIFFQCETEVRQTNSFSERDYGIWKSNYIRNIYRLNKLLLLFFKDDIHRFPENSRKILTSLLKEEDSRLIQPD